MAAQVGLCQQAISKLENAREDPKWETLDKLTKSLGMTREEFGVTWEPLV